MLSYGYVPLDLNLKVPHFHIRTHSEVLDGNGFVDVCSENVPLISC